MGQTLFALQKHIRVNATMQTSLNLVSKESAHWVSVYTGTGCAKVAMGLCAPSPRVWLCFWVGCASGSIVVRHVALPQVAGFGAPQPARAPLSQSGSKYPASQCQDGLAGGAGGAAFSSVAGV